MVLVVDSNSTAWWLMAYKMTTVSFQISLEKPTSNSKIEQVLFSNRASDYKMSPKRCVNIPCLNYSGGGGEYSLSWLFACLQAYRFVSFGMPVLCFSDPVTLCIIYIENLEKVKIHSTSQLEDRLYSLWTRIRIYNIEQVTALLCCYEEGKTMWGII